MRFEIDINQIKIASGEEKVSHTIEELLSMNDLIPAHTGKEITEVTEKQLEGKGYENKSSRGEVEGITEFQLGNDNEGDSRVTQVQIEEAGTSEGGHRPESWDKDEEKIRGHKNTAPIWHEVYKKEDDRKNKVMEKKIKKALFEHINDIDDNDDELLEEEKTTYYYYINLDERGEFFADVRKGSDQGETVFEIKGFDIFEDGFMSDKKDISGLRKYLVHLGIIDKEDSLISGNFR
jgi:hypothetical protein